MRDVHRLTDDDWAAARSLFVGSETPLVYFDGNSLGRPLRSAGESLARFTETTWGERLIRGWDEQWMEQPFAVGDRLASLTLGAAPGQTAIGDSTSVWLYKLIRAAVDARVESGRTTIVIGADDFPTDRYLVEGIAAERGLQIRWVDTDPAWGVTPELLADAVDESVAVVVHNHVSYRSAYVADLGEVCAVAHQAGAWVLADLCHSAGVLPMQLDAWGVDLAVGCTYKYLNGGPGSPAFGYVAQRHQATLTQPIQGWMGHADPFTMGTGYTPAPGMRRFLSGTPPILAMVPLLEMLDLIERFGIEAIRERSIALTERAIEVGEELLTPYGAVLSSPRDPALRGGHVTFDHPRMREVTHTLWAEDVLPDYRHPGGLRIGLSPLSTSMSEVDQGLAAVAAVMDRLGCR